MKMMVLLLVSAVALLATSSPTGNGLDNLRSIIDQIKKVKLSLTTGCEFVEDVKRYYGCEDMFFCKVYDILDSNKRCLNGTEEIKLVRNLRMFKNPICGHSTVLKHVTPTQETKNIAIEITKLIDNLKICSQHRIFNWGKTRSPSPNTSETHVPHVAQ